MFCVLALYTLVSADDLSGDGGVEYSSSTYHHGILLLKTGARAFRGCGGLLALASLGFTNQLELLVEKRGEHLPSVIFGHGQSCESITRCVEDQFGN